MTDDDSDDLSVFREHVGAVQRLSQDKVEPFRNRVPPYPAKTREDEQQVLRDMLSNDFDPAEVETGEQLFFARPGIQHRLLKKLRRGQYRVSAEMDLHGMTVQVAREALALFLKRCLDENQRCVRIIHGKGLGSQNRGPVLKNMVNKWLQQKDEVLAFCSALPVHGGTGAVYVLLKRR